MIPYPEILKAADRSWTLGLVERLRHPTLREEEMNQIIESLTLLSDYRSFLPLQAILGDVQQPEEGRRAASRILREFDYVVVEWEANQLRRWWQEGDEILRYHALRCMDWTCCPEIVEQVASDSNHVWQWVALEQMAFCFDRADQQTIKIAAISHPDPRVRQSAIYSVFYDEPVAAEESLISATNDPEPDVVFEAIRTLPYYPSQKTIRCLHSHWNHPDDQVREAIEGSWEDLRHQILVPLRQKETFDRLRSWLEPVWDLLAFTAEELQPPESSPYTPPRNPEKATYPISPLKRLLENPNVSSTVIQDILGMNGWKWYSPKERKQIRSRLLSHPDPLVRARAIWGFDEWQDVDALIQMTHDACFSIRKSAMYYLGKTPPNPKIAELAWERFQNAECIGCHGSETLETFTHHATREIAIPRLFSLAMDHHRRENLRLGAVDDLIKLQADEELIQLLPCLQETQILTWSFHIRLLDAIYERKLPVPDLKSLQEVDHLDVQEALVKLEIGGSHRV